MRILGTQRPITEQRLHNQRITRPGPRGPEKLVAWMGAVQAQEYGPAKWGLARRSPEGTTEAAIGRAIDAGRILRTHVLRPTWHFVAAADIRWMLELTGPHVHRTMSSYDRQLGLDAQVMTRATDHRARTWRLSVSHPSGPRRSPRAQDYLAGPGNWRTSR